MVRSIKGCENAEILKSGYAVEYDYVNPITLTWNLESKILSNLFLAG